MVALIKQANKRVRNGQYARDKNKKIKKIKRKKERKNTWWKRREKQNNNIF